MPLPSNSLSPIPLHPTSIHLSLLLPPPLSPSNLHISGLLHGALEELAARPLPHPLWPVHLDDVEQGLDGAAQVHDGEDAGRHLAPELGQGVVGEEGDEGHGGQVVHDDDGQDGQHHLEGLLLHRVHDLLPGHGATQHPHHGDVAEDHESEAEEDEAAEELVDAHYPQQALGQGVGDDHAPRQQGDADADLVVTDAGEEDGVDHGHVAIQADAHLGRERETGAMPSSKRDEVDVAPTLRAGPRLCLSLKPS